MTDLRNVKGALAIAEAELNFVEMDSEKHALQQIVTLLQEFIDINKSYIGLYPRFEELIDVIDLSNHPVEHGISRSAYVSMCLTEIKLKLEKEFSTRVDIQSLSDDKVYLLTHKNVKHFYAKQ